MALRDLSDGQEYKVPKCAEKADIVEALVGDVGSSVGDCVGTSTYSFV